jgi:hypothetical protein
VTDAHFSADISNHAEPGAGVPPLCGLAPLPCGDTWITIGDPEVEQERTVTVVFRRDPLDGIDPLQETETGEFLLRPLAPLFPGR